MQSKLKIWTDPDGSIHMTVDLLVKDLMAANLSEDLHEQVRLLGYSEKPSDWLRATAILWDGLKSKPEIDVSPGLLGKDL